MTEIIATDKPKPDKPMDKPITVSWHLYRTLVGLGLICSLLIVSTYLLTAPKIECNRQVALQAAIYQVLPGATSSKAYRLVDGNLEAAANATNQSEVLFAGYDDQGILVGMAIQASGIGYQDTITVIYGYDPRRQQIIGLQVLSSRETPGLGDRIANYTPFLANFEALDVSLDSDFRNLLQPLTAVKEGTKTTAWQIDGITGATISSNAVASILQTSVSAVVPLIFQARNRLQEDGQR